ncbi:hypothetical protein Q2T41_06995 [Maribacter confluentis]|uniref:Alpha/beta hydrolase n=2 Tax=Maribacter confluentis TaxID=1656093 RepID=A0ABT8RNB2_9FLAO|nr:hypothetical protein [Maribacter confluentis]MDO1512396.1 hypothetical protein [Maribacter confluentis]
MLKLGYHKYGLQGGDIGAGISIRIAQKYPESIIGLHLNYISGSYVPYFKENEPMDPHILSTKNLPGCGTNGKVLMLWSIAQNLCHWHMD